MADYIRRDIVLKIINTVNDTGGFAGYADYCVLFDEIDTIPASEVQPVKHGKWIYVGSVRSWDEIKCSACDSAFSTEDRDLILNWDFCPHCGARMDGETNG